MNINELVPIVPTRSGNTRQISPSKNWVFTYNVHMSIPEIYEFKTLCSNSSKKWVFQEEIGESGNHHLQGFICFDRKVRPKSVFLHHPTIHWEKCRDVAAAIRYCQKEDTRVKDSIPYSQGVIAYKPLRVLDYEKFYKWQLQTVKDIVTDEDDRTIYWMYENEGNVGKSALVKYLCVNNMALLLSGKSADMKYGLKSYEEKNGGFPSLILIDIPRTVLDYVSYSAIEEIKNGCLFSGKYEASMCIFNSPTIICFANEPPKREKMSKDRWKVYEIIEKELYLKMNFTETIYQKVAPGYR